MTKNINKRMQKVFENRLQELLRCARKSGAKEVKILPDGIEITVNSMVSTPLMRAAVYVHNCYPDGGVYVTSRDGKLVLCLYYKPEA